MGNRNQIQALPSVLVFSDSSVRILYDLTEEEIQQCMGQLVTSVEEQMNYYFLQHPEEWEHIF
ncbi:MAG: hypothetical protein IKV59_01630 [Lachnospiraceae bacterium]|nr:hypothetical protein [Lachnospiraceae bacterium]